MIGRRVESRSGLPWGALLFLVVGGALAVAAPAAGVGWPAVAAALPLALGFAALVIGRDRPFSAEFTAAAVAADDPPVTVPYDGLRNVWAGGRSYDPARFRKPTAAIDVEHDGGLLHIPARLDAPSHEVYRFLAGLVSETGGRDVDPALAEYLQRQESYFGADQVWTYTASGRRTRRFGRPRLRSFCAGLILGGAAWMAAGFSGLADVGWGLAGVFAAVLGVMVFAASFAENTPVNRRHRSWKRSSLVIGPQGMAMVQGPLQGEVRWPELVDVGYWPRPSSVLARGGALTSLRLRVKGADILIFDIYDRPLYVIHDRIRACAGLAEARTSAPE